MVSLCGQRPERRLSIRRARFAQRERHQLSQAVCTRAPRSLTRGLHAPRSPGSGVRVGAQEGARHGTYSGGSPALPCMNGAYRSANEGGGCRMAKLIYSAITSLDGYVEDKDGKFDWAAPDDEVHAFVNDLERPIATYLYGRRMYETMVFWETVSTEADEPAVFWDYAGIWRAAEKIVYSRALQTVSSARTRIEREFDRDAVRRR